MLRVWSSDLEIQSPITQIAVVGGMRILASAPFRGARPQGAGLRVWEGTFLEGGPGDGFLSRADLVRTWALRIIVTQIRMAA